MVWACVHSVNSTSHTSFGSTKIASGLGGLLENGFVSRHSGVSRVSSLFSVASVNPVPSSFHYAFIILALCFLCCGAWNAPDCVKTLKNFFMSGKFPTLYQDTVEILRNCPTRVPIFRFSCTGTPTEKFKFEFLHSLAPLYDQRTGRKGYSRPPDSRTQAGARLGARSIGRGKLPTSYLHWSH